MIIALQAHQYGFKPFGGGGGSAGEMLADPEFNSPMSDATWVGGPTWQLANGKATLSGNSDEQLYQLVQLEAGKSYRVFVVVESFNGGGIYVNFLHPDNNSGFPGGYRKLVGGDNDYTIVAPATETRKFAIGGNPGSGVVLSASLTPA